MSKYEAELRRRLTSGEDIEETGCWYRDRVIESELEWADLSPLETAFWCRLTAAFEKWMANQKRH